MSGIPAVLLVAGVFTVVGVVEGARRSLRAGRLDLFHPMIFASVYVALVCLVPCGRLWLSPTGESGMRISRFMLAEHTPWLMALAVVGFTLGCAMPFRQKAIRAGTPMRPEVLATFGRMLILVPMGVVGLGFANGGVAERGAGQNEVTFLDSLYAARDILAPTAVALMLAARFLQGRKLFGGIDAVLIATMVGLIGLIGERGPALAILIIFLVFATRRRGALLTSVLGLAGVLAFALVVMAYRTTAVGLSNQEPLIDMLLMDSMPLTLTTGLVAEQVAGGRTWAARRSWPGCCVNFPGR
ncbi:hypothetical protein GCM10029963_21750 [Micromonospora andamanensis]